MSDSETETRPDAEMTEEATSSSPKRRAQRAGRGAQAKMYNAGDSSDFSDGSEDDEPQPKKRKGAAKASKKASKKAAPKKKRALSAFMMFSQAERPRVKEENPDATFGEFGKLLGAEWKALGDDGQAPWKAKAAEAKAAHEAEADDDEPIAKRGKGKKAAAAPKKKRALSAFMIFSQSERPRIKEENPDASFGEFGKLLGAEWKALGDDGQAPWKAKAEAAKEAAAEADDGESATATPARKRAKTASSSSSSSSSGSGSSSSSSSSSASVPLASHQFRTTKLYTTGKGQLVQKCLLRWQYVDEWNQPVVVTDVPIDHTELTGFPGVFLCVRGRNQGELLDMRGDAFRPTFNSLWAMDSSDLKDFAVRAFEGQLQVLQEAEGTGVDLYRELKRELAKLRALNVKSFDKEAVQAEREVEQARAQG